MSAATYNFTINTGETWSQTLIYSSVDEEGNKVPVDLTGYTAKMQIRDKVGHLKVSLTNEDGIEITPEEGKLVITIPHSLTSEFKFAAGNYDLFIIQGSTYKILLYGAVTVRESATQ